MTPVEPAVPDGEVLVVFAKDQPQYLPLPASVGPTGIVTTEWEPTAEELEQLFVGGRVQLRVYTFGQPLQPVSVSVLEPECGMRES